jgi:peptide/nickel transport system substrate-binding protein
MKLRKFPGRAAILLIGLVLIVGVVTFTSIAAPAQAPVAQAEVADPIPYPEPPDLGGLPGGDPVRLPINEIVTYGALPEYNQSPSLDAFVASGELPPVEERLPEEPQIYLTGGMQDGIGVYGDVFRGFSACPTAGYNDMAGTTMGWFGIESYTTRYGGLIKVGPLYRTDQDIEPFPNLAMDWEWSDDGTQLTMNLIRGAKWSDGHPFTADDVIFTWEAYVVDPNVNAPRKLSHWTWEGEEATLEKVDDYTVLFTFPVERPLDMWYHLNEEFFHVMPAHQLREHHPLWSEADPAPTYVDFANALTPQTLPLVTMGPWVITEYYTDELMIMRRNPYYWKVDEAGNQLPYIDEIQYVKGPSGIGRDLCTIAGDCDHMNLENPSTFVEAMTRSQAEDAPFTVTWGAELLGYEIDFNYSLQLGIEDDVRDVALRELFRDVRFRRALSYATDREGIAQSIMRGPFLRGWGGGLLPGSPEFSRESVVYLPFDVASANALLDEIGLVDTSGDGVRQWTDGPLAGEPVVIQLTANQDQAEAVTIGEALVNLWGDIGIQINLRVVDSATRVAQVEAGTWDMHAYRTGQAMALPFRDPAGLAPITETFPRHRVPTGADRQVMDFEQDLIDIITEYRSTFDTDARRELMFDYNQIYTDNVYSVGVFSGRYGLGLSGRLRNVQPGLPVFLYTWVEDAILLDTVWTAEEDQLEQNRPNTIPDYSGM